jgi:aspartyl-tRNA(Asn)/glutamyl-tRNA(Gln) amidotransferase subunit A
MSAASSTSSTATSVVQTIARRLAAGETSAVEVATRYLDRLRRVEGQLNSFIAVDEEGALRQVGAAVLGRDVGWGCAAAAACCC